MDYHLITTQGENEPGINGAIAPLQHPNDTTINTFSVASIEEFAQKVVETGGA